MYGSAVKQIDVVKEIKTYVPSNQDKRKNRKNCYMSLPYTLFLMISLISVFLILFGYLYIQHKVISTTQYISSQESYLARLNDENKEFKCKLESNIDYEEIKRIAIGELGMSYPTREQIIKYKGAECDYFMKVQND